MSLSINFQKVNKKALSDLQLAFEEAVLKEFANANIEFLRKFVRDNIRETTTYASLIGDGGTRSLMAEFGLPNEEAESRVNAVIDVICDNIEYQVKKEKGGITLNFYAIVADFKDITSLTESIVITKKGTELPWLQWLLLDGRKRSIIKGYTVVRKQGAKGSRSNFALMARTGRDWAVPPEFSGTIGDNWLIRLIDSISEEIYNLIERFVKEGDNV